MKWKKSDHYYFASLSLCSYSKELSVIYRINSLPNGTLKIANATRQDAGSYTCIAKNQFGTASTTGKLLITGESGMQTLLHFREAHGEFFFPICPHQISWCRECVIVQPEGRKFAVSLWKCRAILASALTWRVLDRFMSPAEGSLFGSHHPH